MHPQLAVRSEEVLSEITAMWANIGNSLQIFEVYKEFIDRDVSLQEALFDILVELLLFGVFTIKTIKVLEDLSRLQYSSSGVSFKIRSF